MPCELSGANETLVMPGTQVPSLEYNLIFMSLLRHLPVRKPGKSVSEIPKEAETHIEIFLQSRKPIIEKLMRRPSCLIHL